MSQVPEWKKHEYWNHFVERMYVDGYGGAHGMTGPRLRRIKPVLWNDDHFWNDIIMRHNAHGNSPEHLHKIQPETYEHCLGNFWGQIVQTMVEQGMLR